MKSGSVRKFSKKCLDMRDASRKLNVAVCSLAAAESSPPFFPPKMRSPARRHTKLLRGNYFAYSSGYERRAWSIWGSTILIRLAKTSLRRPTSGRLTTPATLILLFRRKSMPQIRSAHFRFARELSANVRSLFCFRSTATSGCVGLAMVEMARSTQPRAAVLQTTENSIPWRAGEFVMTAFRSIRGMGRDAMRVIWMPAAFPRRRRTGILRGLARPSAPTNIFGRVRSRAGRGFRAGCLR